MKYYVRSGALERIVIADSPLEACEQALCLANGEMLDEYFYVDERGFRGPTTPLKSKGPMTLANEVIDFADVVNVRGQDNEYDYYDDQDFEAC